MQIQIYRKSRYFVCDIEINIFARDRTLYKVTLWSLMVINTFKYFRPLCARKKFCTMNYGICMYTYIAERNDKILMYDSRIMM